MSRSHHDIIMDARRTLGAWTNVDFARFLGVSTRTVQRHPPTGIPMGNYGEKIIRAVHPKDPALAQEIAQAYRMDLAELGLETRTTSSATVALARPTREHAAVVICA